MNTLEQRARALYERAMSEVAAAARKAGQDTRPAPSPRAKRKGPSPTEGKMPRYSVVESFRKSKSETSGGKKKRAGAKPKKKAHVYKGK